MEERHQYDHRTVTVGYDWHVEIRGFQPVDEVELEELLRTLNQKHGWPQHRQVFVVGPHEKGIGFPLSVGLQSYENYVTKIRVGPQGSDVKVTPWTKDSLL